MRQLDHRGQVVLDLASVHARCCRRCRWCRRGSPPPSAEIDHVGAEAHQHLRRGLPGDAAVDVGLAGKELVPVAAPPASVIESPKKTTRASPGAPPARVVGAVAGQLGPVRQPLLQRSHLFARSEAGGATKSGWIAAGTRTCPMAGSSSASTGIDAMATMDRREIRMWQPRVEYRFKQDACSVLV